MSSKHVRSCKGRSEAITDLLAHEPASVMPFTTMTRLGGGSSKPLVTSDVQIGVFPKKSHGAIVRQNSRTALHIFRTAEASPLPRTSSHKAEATTASAAVECSPGLFSGKNYPLSIILTAWSKILLSLLRSSFLVEPAASRSADNLGSIDLQGYSMLDRGKQTRINMGNRSLNRARPLFHCLHHVNIPNT